MGDTDPTAQRGGGGLSQHTVHNLDWVKGTRHVLIRGHTDYKDGILQ